MKKALLLCASHNDLGLIRGLKRLGYQILAIGNIPGLPGEADVDRYIRMDYSQKEQVLELAAGEEIDVICQCCNDYGVYTASYVAEKLGLPGYDSYDTICRLHHKDRFKVFADENNIMIPEFYDFSWESEAVAWLEKQDRYPWIVKPIDASAGNGIHVIRSFQEGAEAVKAAFSRSREGRIIIEQYIEGSQHGFCTFLLNRRVVAVADNNEYSILNPYRVEIDTFPATSGDEVRTVLIRQVERIAKLLNLTDGIFHLQYIMDEESPKIIEVMRRVPGNMYTVPANKLCGLDWDYWEVRARCGLSCAGFPGQKLQGGSLQGQERQGGYYAYKTLLAVRNGRIGQIKIPERYEKYIYEKFVLKKPGDVITDYRNQPVGFLFMEFASQEEMHQVLIEDYRNDCVAVQED